MTIELRIELYKNLSHIYMDIYMCVCTHTHTHTSTSAALCKGNY